LSLDSFHDLSPLFRQIADDVAWGDEEFHWTLALPNSSAAGRKSLRSFPH
jgi:hypothetical protein